MGLYAHLPALVPHPQLSQHRCPQDDFQVRLTVGDMPSHHGAVLSTFLGHTPMGLFRYLRCSGYNRALVPCPVSYLPHQPMAHVLLPKLLLYPPSALALAIARPNDRLRDVVCAVRMIRILMHVQCQQ